MPERMTRLAGRSPVAHLEVITVYRDRLNLPYQQMMAALEHKADVYAVYSVIGLLHDVSPGGVGLSFEGQQVRAQNLLRAGENYVLQLTLSLPEAPDELAPYLKVVETKQLLLVRAVCRWEQVNDGVSRVGFEFLDTNPAVVLKFLVERLGAPKLAVPG